MDDVPELEKEFRSSTSDEELKKIRASEAAFLDRPAPSIKGSLVRTETAVSAPKPKLKGSLIDEQPHPTTISLSVGDRIMNRDSGDIYEVVGTINTSHGVRVQLRAVEQPTKITLDKDELERKLNTPGEAWSTSFSAE